MISSACDTARLIGGIAILFAWATTACAADAPNDAVSRFRSEIEPILEANCYACHGYGSSEGQVTLDEFKDSAKILEPNLWLKVLQNVRAGIMPPSENNGISYLKIPLNVI